MDMILQLAIPAMLILVAIVVIGMVFGYFPPRVTMWAPNLTPTHLGEWTDGELQRAFVSGLGRDGLVNEAMHLRRLCDAGFARPRLQRLDDAVRELRLQPLLQFEVSYRF